MTSLLPSGRGLGNFCAKRPVRASQLQAHTPAAVPPTNTLVERQKTHDEAVYSALTVRRNRGPENMANHGVEISPIRIGHVGAARWRPDRSAATELTLALTEFDAPVIVIVARDVRITFGKGCWPHFECGAFNHSTTSPGLIFGLLAIPGG
jgi:hypothetical protein